MDVQQQSDSAGASSALAAFVTTGDWLKTDAGPFFPNKASFEWFVKKHRDELVERGALIPRGGRAGSLVSRARMPEVVLDILKRQALDKKQQQ